MAKVPGSTTEPVDADSAAARATAKLTERYADESYKLFLNTKVDDPTPEEAKKIRNKCVTWILSFLCIGYHLMYVDKQTVSSGKPFYSSILQILMSCSWEAPPSSESWKMQI